VPSKNGAIPDDNSAEDLRYCSVLFTYTEGQGRKNNNPEYNEIKT
jgi:hypothetical protein